MKIKTANVVVYLRELDETGSDQAHGICDEHLENVLHYNPKYQSIRRANAEILCEYCQQEHEHAAIRAVTPDDLGKLRHMLGAEPSVPKKSHGYRNRYITTRGDTGTEQAMERLLAAGLVVRGNETQDTITYHATRGGAILVGIDPDHMLVETVIF